MPYSAAVSPKAEHTNIVYFFSKRCDFSRHWKGRIPELSGPSKQLLRVNKVGVNSKIV